MEVISVESARFKHQRVEAEIRHLAEAMPVGARLPAERKMAEMYGCNFLTVRRALKQLVEDGVVVRKIGSGTFVARHGAGARATGRAKGGRVGVLVWQGGDAYSSRVMQGIAHEAAGQGVELRSGWVRDYAGDGLAQVKILEQDGCEAIILPWFPHDRSEEVRAFVRACGLPVSLPIVIPGLEGNSFEQQEVFGNSLQVASEQLCAFFYALGHRRIALLGPDLPGDVVLHRLLSAYTCYTSRVNLPNFCGLVRPGPQSMAQLAERWSAFRGDFAVISYDDDHALRFMAAMHTLGLRAPEDFQIIGYGDTEGGVLSDPPLSTVRQDFNYIGRWLIKSALALARGDREQSGSLPRAELLVRATCGGAARIDAALRRQSGNLDIVVERSPETQAGE